MATLSTPLGTTGEVATKALFGGNILAHRSAMDEPQSHADAIEDLGVTGLRYPGGTLTENYFDISNPDASRAFHADTGEEVDFIPISEFLEYAGSGGHSATIVIPTRDQLSKQETDSLGDRIPDIDEQELRGFINDVVSGVYGSAEIKAFEIGNEYWGSGRMNANEYGRLASEMAEIIHDELHVLAEEGVDTAETDIIVQMGENFKFSKLSEDYENTSMPTEEILSDLNEAYELDLSFEESTYNSGEINWQYVNNEIVLKSFIETDSIDLIDGVVPHVYSRGEEMPQSRYNDLNVINESWREARDDLEIHVTEWNQKSTPSLDVDNDYGLFQAHEMLNIVEGFMKAGVDQAHVWPLIQSTRNTLGEGVQYDKASVAGEMFKMISSTLPGKTLLDFQPGEKETEETVGNLDVHGFVGEDDLVFYIASTDRENVSQVDLDVSNLVSDFGSLEARVLGVQSGDSPGSSRESDPHLEYLDANSVYDDGFIEIVLEPGEIMEIKFSDVTPTDAFASVLGLVSEPTIADPDDPIIPKEVEPQEDDNELEDGLEDETEDPSMGLEWALALLPLIALLGG